MYYGHSRTPSKTSHSTLAVGIKWRYKERALGIVAVEGSSPLLRVVGLFARTIFHGCTSFHIVMPPKFRMLVTYHTLANPNRRQLLLRDFFQFLFESLVLILKIIPF